MASQIDICNVALTDVGGNAINAIDEGGKEADLCYLYWDSLVDEVLSEHTWNFAKKWVNLAEDSGYVMVDGEYSTAFQLPNDYIRISRPENLALQYEIRETTLLCNEDTLAIEYIFRVSNVEKFTPGFRMALIARLRASLAIPMARKGSKAVDWMGIYLSRELPNAKKKDSNENSPSEEAVHRHIDATDSWLVSR